MATPRLKKTRLGILFGGRSGEHEISLISAASVIRALDPARFEIAAIGITKEGRLASSAQVKAMLPEDLHGRISARNALVSSGSHMRLLSAGGEETEASEGVPDIIFPLLHGPYGEDGTIQGMLEIAGLPYIGCGVLASSAGMDKDIMKRLFVHAGLPVLPFKVVKRGELQNGLENLRACVEREFGYPVFSKPANLGSSVGVVKIHDASQFAEGLRYSSQFDAKILIEKGINARELECSILGNEQPEASGVGEILPQREYYDYDAKYNDPNSRIEIPARIPEDVAEEIRRIAVQAFKCIDGSGLSRVDFFMERNSGVVWLNEINTMPGFTPISMYPKLWDAAGIGFNALVDRLIELGLERFRERSIRKITDR